MGHVAPVPREQLPGYEPLFSVYEQIMGLVPTTVFTMARVPGLIEGYVGMAHAAAMNKTRRRAKAWRRASSHDRPGKFLMSSARRS